jgi:hypothetical protein
LISAELALSVAFRTSLAALAVGFVEQLVVYDRAFGSRGPFSPAMADIFRRVGARNAWLSRLLPFVLVTGAVAGLVGVVTGPYALAGRISGVSVLCCVAVTRLRRVTASDGAEQMAILTLIATCLAVVPSLNRGSITVAVWFIAGQAVLSYVTAGVTKVVSPTWMGGGAIPLIMGSESHGQPWAAAIFDAYPGVGRLLTRSVVVFECLFPLVLIAPPPVTFGLLVLGFSFHLGCAVAMGLNAFLLAFPGSYVCVAYVASMTSPYR